MASFCVVFIARNIIFIFFVLFPCALQVPKQITCIVAGGRIPRAKVRGLYVAGWGGLIPFLNIIQLSSRSSWAS